MTDSSAVPIESPCQGALDDDRFELAAELGHRLRHPIPCRRRTRQRQSAIEGVFHLGRVSDTSNQMKMFTWTDPKSPDSASSASSSSGP